MQGGKEKEHAWPAQPIVSDERPTALSSASAPIALTSGPSTSGAIASELNVGDEGTTHPSTTQPSDPDAQSGFSARSVSQSDSGANWEVLVNCNSLIEAYCKGEISKAAVYVEIQSKLAKVLSDNRARTDATFGSFIVTIKSHNLEIEAAINKGRAVNLLQCSPSSVISISDGQSDGEPDTENQGWQISLCLDCK